jgi:dUTP pyrophosphatase
MMERDKIENYIKKLKDLESQINDEDTNEDINSDDDIMDENFMNELNTVLNSLTKDIEVNLMAQGNPPNDLMGAFNFNTPTITTLDIKVKKLSPDAIIPSYSKDGDAGMDLTITKEIENTSFSVSYGFGIAMEIPKGYVGLVFPRSSVRNQELILSNCVGVIDSGYRGELQATFKKTNGLDSFKYKVGERGAQIIIFPYPQVKFVETDNLSNTDRGDGGFGSTGK